MDKVPENKKNRLPLCALGTFALGTTELVIVGLLPEVAGDLGVGIPTAGLLVIGLALSVVFGGPILTVAYVGGGGLYLREAWSPRGSGSEATP